MNQVQISIHENRQNFEPGEELRGQASWKLLRPARRIEVRLCWFTGGAAIPEATLVDKKIFQHPKLEETRPFGFRLPQSPYSFQGTFTTLLWAVEVVVLSSQQCARALFTMSPTGDAVRLEALCPDTVAL